MDSLLLVFDTILMILVCHWAKVNDAAGNSGTPGGLFSYRTGQAQLSKQASQKTLHRDAKR